MDILVTGATGFIGQHIVPRLRERGDTVIALARDERKARRCLWLDGVRFIPYDLHRDLDDQTISRFDGIKTVIHLAWSCLSNYEDPCHYEQNLPAHFRFLKALVTHGVDHVLVTGTCLEYGLQSGALAESGPTAPCTAYGMAKDTLHKFLLLEQDRLSFALQWARLFYLHGPGQNPRSVLAQLDEAIDRNEPVFNMSGGEQLRDYLPVEEAAAYLTALIHQPRYQGTFNVCSGIPISVRRLVEDQVGKRDSRIKLNMGYQSYPAYEPMAFWGELGRLAAIRRELGITWR